MLNITNNLPENFVYLDQIDPSIRQNMMYYSTHNFIGEQISGYKAARAILTIQAALALKNLQQDLKKDNYSLVIYDAYRPKKAVEHFVKWSKDVNDHKMKQFYYPYINKEEIFKLGYVAAQSAHSSGSTVDLTIIEIDKILDTKPTMTMRPLTDGRAIPYFDDNTVNMYSSVDLMDSASAHDCTLIDEEGLKNRNYLRSKMQEHKFKEYHVEWWHYTLKDEPYPHRYFDFDIV
ncbi:M15 family metallopeptidase [Candidatus Tisiphia endosymbiont of Nemotelus uliginosus]|uniref:M15 family metallopeptidase n=1 Tax=Candidatus Tisiphia endosymbiont of Nemotelus uliginosus TaxID=3077926 RepID=UPI0035C8B819